MAKKIIIATNKKAFHNFSVEEKLEAGIVLNGCEIKSIRDGKINIKEGYVSIDSNEAWLHGCHISPYKQGSHQNEDPIRIRKLLLHKKQINKLIGKVNEKGYSLIPLSVYLLGAKAKLEIGLCKGKKLHDKRESIKKRSIDREIQRGLSIRS